MQLVRLIYVSTVTQDFSPLQIAEILSSAKKHNEVNGITGLLCFNSQRFLQCLEGARDQINATYQRISNDARHHKITLLEYQEIHVREFESWNMGFVPEANIAGQLILRYSGHTAFEPYKMSGTSAHQLLLALRDTMQLQ